MDLNTIWFILFGVLITGYAILDGFDLGAGILHLWTRNEPWRRISINAIGPVWDGNEVWLLTAGGALFAAFPIVYATVFSGFYLALMLLLVALIGRAVAIEFRGKVDNPAWRRLWDWVFGLGSLLPAILFGVAVGNILRGLPIDEKGMFTGSFLGLLNPYAVLVGLVSLAMCTMHGSVYLTMKTDGEQRLWARKWASNAWIAFVALYFLATLATVFVSPFLFQSLPGNPLFWVVFLLELAGMIYLPVALKAGRFGRAFLASAVTIAGAIGVAALSLYPRLVPSLTSLDYSLTITTASSTPRTLAVMLVIALLGMPLVIAYTIYIYRVFRGKVVLDEQSY